MSSVPPLRFLQRALSVAAALACFISCNNLAGATDPSNVSFIPFRISVQDVAVQPSPVDAGNVTTIRFRLTRNGGDGPIFWATHFMENPNRGGRLSASSGGPVPSGSVVEVRYETMGPTLALVTIYPGSTPQAPTGDGTGDWHSFAIEVRGR